uniref:Spliceosome-associated protein 62 n=1 Tax=Antonospora locustae TaxID=278021 RepID=Q6E6H6_ANTLO|nr:spliceosome-associated protein 62 [Antonospora locustae]
MHIDREERGGFKNTVPPTIADIKDEKVRRSTALLKRLHGLDADPHFVTNNSGRYECSLCRTLHTTVQSFILHKSGKRHCKMLAGAQIRAVARPGYIRTRSLLMDGLRGFGVEIEFVKARKHPVYRFEETSSGNFLYISAVPYKVLGFRYEGQVTGDNLSEYFDEKERRYFLHFFVHSC